MKFKDYFKTGAVVTSLVIGAANLEAKGLEGVVSQTKQVQQVEQKKSFSASELVKAATLEDSLGFVDKVKKNTPFKQQIKKYGLKKTVEHLAEMKYYSIDMAEEYSHDPNEIPADRYLVASKAIGKAQVDFRKGYTKPLDKKVILARAKSLKIVVERHRKLLKGNDNLYNKKDVQGQYRALIKANFTRKEYTKYCVDISDAMDNYYDALADSLGWKKIFGQGDIDKMKKTSRESYFKTRDKIYGRGNNGGEKR